MNEMERPKAAPPAAGSALEARYLGETSRRRPWIAFLLGLLSPGAAWAYVGRLGLGLLANLGAIALWAGFVLVWASRKFYPVAPLRAFLIGWVVLVTMAALDAARLARRESDDYVLRESNHPLVYAGVILFAFALPLAALYHVATHQLWTVVSVSDDSMYPTLVAGDRILVDRNAHRSRSPEAGDVVLFELEDEALRFGRIVGGPGDEVAVTDDVVFTNDQPAVRRRLDDTERAQVAEISGPISADVSHHVEELGTREYHVVIPRHSFEAEPTQWHLAADEYVVLNDNRGERGDSRRLGVVRRDQIVGRPLFVGFSAEGSECAVPLALRAFAPCRRTSDYRTSREGRRVQPPRPPAQSG